MTTPPESVTLRYPNDGPALSSLDGLRRTVMNEAHRAAKAMSVHKKRGAVHAVLRFGQTAQWWNTPFHRELRTYRLVRKMFRLGADGRLYRSCGVDAHRRYYRAVDWLELNELELRLVLTSLHRLIRSTY